MQYSFARSHRDKVRQLIVIGALKSYVAGRKERNAAYEKAKADRMRIQK